MSTFRFVSTFSFVSTSCWCRRSVGVDVLFLVIPLQFIILQSTGGETKGLTVPELSASYRWTAAAVAGRNAKVPICVLAQDRLEVFCVFKIKIGTWSDLN